MNECGGRQGIGKHDREWPDRLTLAYPQTGETAWTLHASHIGWKPPGPLTATIFGLVDQCGGVAMASPGSGFPTGSTSDSCGPHFGHRYRRAAADHAGAETRPGICCGVNSLNVVRSRSKGKDWQTARPAVDAVVKGIAPAPALGSNMSCRRLRQTAMSGPIMVEVRPPRLSRMAKSLTASVASTARRCTESMREKGGAFPLQPVDQRIDFLVVAAHLDFQSLRVGAPSRSARSSLARRQTRGESRRPERHRSGGCGADTSLLLS